jgi:hypothetical protein
MPFHKSAIGAAVAFGTLEWPQVVSARFGRCKFGAAEENGPAAAAAVLTCFHNL